MISIVSRFPPPVADRTPQAYVRQCFDAVLPALEGRRDTSVHPVVIVGGGPVGLTTALSLARYGIRSVVLEQDDGTCTGSRAICVSRRSLEILAQLDAADAILSKGLAWTGGRSFHRDRQVLHFEMPSRGGERLPPMVNIQQYYVEQALLDRIACLSSLIEVRWQARAAAVVQTPDHVEIEVETPAGAYSMQGDWLVACDGGRSSVREALGLPLAGTQYEGRYVIVDIEMRSARPAERYAWFDPPSNPGSTILMHKQPDEVWRIDYQVRDDEDPDEAVKPENVLPRVRSHLAMIGETGSWRPLWISIYNAKCLTLDRYVHGRVIFAGDAAHLVPIFGVRGMNSGIDDAFNLGWKLAFVARGWADAALLDSYAEERRYAALENMRQGAKSTEFMAPPHYGFRLMRQAVLELAVKHPAVRSLINPRQSVAIVLTDSRLNEPDDPAFSAGAPPGATVADVPVRPCSYLSTESDDAAAASKPSPGATHLGSLLGVEVCLLFFGRPEQLPERWQRTCDALHADGFPVAVLALLSSKDDAPTSVHFPSLRAVCKDSDAEEAYRAFDAVPGAAYLLRPDGHVLARWRNAGRADADETWRRLFSHKRPAKNGADLPEPDGDS